MGQQPPPGGYYPPPPPPQSARYPPPSPASPGGYFAPPPQPPARAPDGERGCLIAALTGLALMVVAGGLFFVSWRTGDGPLTCTMQRAGTHLNVTVGGWGWWNCGGLTSSEGWYSTAPSGVLICRYYLKSQSLTVRDDGALMLLGNAMCASLQQQQAAP